MRLSSRMKRSVMIPSQPSSVLTLSERTGESAVGWAGVRECHLTGASHEPSSTMSVVISSDSVQSRCIALAGQRTYSPARNG